MAISRRYILVPAGVLLLLLCGVTGARFYLPIWVKGFVGRQINQIPGYEGEVRSIDISLYRGAYTIHGLEIRKTASGIPVPFIFIETMDLSVEWGALLHRRIVSKIEADKPVLNFAVSARGAQKQNGAGVDWAEKVKKLIPIDINSFRIKDGTVTYRDYSTKPEINLPIEHIEGWVNNLRNVVEKDRPLPSSLFFTGESIGKGRLEVYGRMDILAQPMETEMAFKLEQVHLPAINDFLHSYFLVDAKSGIFDFYSELKIHNGKVSGYIKPIATHVSLIDLDVENNPLKLAWETLVTIVMEAFTNQRKDQFATKIPLSGDIGNVTTDVWRAIVGIVRNAFIEAIKKGPEGELESLRGLKDGGR